MVWEYLGLEIEELEKVPLKLTAHGAVHILYGEHGGILRRQLRIDGLGTHPG